MSVLQDRNGYPAYCRIAQSVEQRAVNAEVVGSSPTLTAKIISYRYIVTERRLVWLRKVRE